MKKFRKLIFIMFFVFAVSALYAETNFSINLIGNIGYVPNSSMDDAVKGYGDYVADSIDPTIFKGKDEKAVLGLGADIEARLFLGSIGFGLSAGYQYGGEARSVAEASGYSSEQYLALSLSSISYLGTLYYKYSFDETRFILLGIGGGYYQGTMTLTEEATKFVSGNFKNEYDFNGSTWGGHVRIEPNIMLGPVVVFGGIMGRYANIDEFNKNGTTLTSAGKNIEGSFTGVLLYLGAGLHF